MADRVLQKLVLYCDKSDLFQTYKNKRFSFKVAHIGKAYALMAYFEANKNKIRTALLYVDYFNTDTGEIKESKKFDLLNFDVSDGQTLNTEKFKVKSSR